MTSDIPNNETQSPIIDFKATEDLTDYFCPFCSEKLFRGKVSKFNMVCSNCNKLVRSENIPENTSQDQE